MDFYICPVSEEELDYEEDVTLFKAKDGRKFHYNVEYEDDTVCISDSLGRYVPIDLDKLDDFIEILTRISFYAKNKVSVGKFLYEKLVQGTNQ